VIQPWPSDPAEAGRVSAVSFRGVSKHFIQPGGTRLEVLHDVNFEAPAGDIIAILGRSGSGKTTLLNIAAGLIKPDAGRAIILGQDTGGAVDWNRVGYMFQDDRLLPWRIASSNVSLALEAGAMPAIERRRRAREGLALVGLAEFAESYPHQLSGGMRSRVALARSLVGEPDLLLMDEPFSRLDAQTRDSMHSELLRIHALRRMSIIFVTHDVEEAVILANSIIMLSARPGWVHRRVEVSFPQPRRRSSEAMTLAAELRNSIGVADWKEDALS
jgi:ABC-type nitrate/sulfonate/bicarbonate transport system ATPase subunit